MAYGAAFSLQRTGMTPRCLDARVSPPRATHDTTGLALGFRLCASKISHELVLVVLDWEYLNS